MHPLCPAAAMLHHHGEAMLNSRIWILNSATIGAARVALMQPYDTPKGVGT
jgi:hypothetical protein